MIPCFDHQGDYHLLFLGDGGDGVGFLRNVNYLLYMYSFNHEARDMEFQSVCLYCVCVLRVKCKPV